MSLSALIWGQSQFDEAVDKATSELRLNEEDIALNLEICDQIRSKSVPPKDAARAIKRRLNHKNPNVQLLALGLLDTCIKNGGDHFLNEVASKEFMDNLVSVLKIKDLNFEVKNKILRLIQNWSTAFEGKYTLGYVGQVYKDLKSSGFQFPPKDLTLANSAMIDTSTAPEWIDSDVCLKCRDPFTFMNRKHHCRNCGGVFDHRCSSKTMPLPHFGITQEVRVCDPCHVKLTKSRERERPQSVDFTRSTNHPRQDSISRKRRSVRDFSDADIQRAIQLSLQEGPASKPSWESSEPPLYDRSTRPRHRAEEEDDAELQAAIQASLREASAPKPSAPITSPSPSERYNGYALRDDYFHNQDHYDNRTPVPRSPGTPRTQLPLPSLPNHDLGLNESDAILTFSQTVHDARSRGDSDLSRIPNIHDLYSHASGLRPKLALSLDETGRKEEMLAEMHEKLSEAVKLYDSILTEQISRPRWRSPPVSQQQSYGYNPLSQWSATQANTSQVATYVPSPPPVPVLSTRPTTTYSEPQYAVPPAVQVGPSYQHSASSYYSPETSQNQPYQQPTSPVSVSPPHLNSLQSPPEQALHSQGRWSSPQNDQYQSIHGALGNAAPPVSYSQAQLPASTIPAPQPQPPQQIYSPAPEQTHAQPYPPSVIQQHHHELSSPAMPTMSRHNTISQAHSSVSFASAPVPAMANGVNSTSYHHNVTTSPVPPQSYHVPSFPTAPSSDPISLSMYSPPTGFEKPEQKEVMLIDL